METHHPATKPEYQVRLPTFQGPMALLLHLVEENELDITQVALAQITDEFIAYVEAMQDAEPTARLGVMADFLAVAARLLWIKSRLLLPAPPRLGPASSAEADVGDALVEQLRAYRRYKVAAQWLRERHAAGLRAYVRLAPPPCPRHPALSLEGVTVDDLAATARRLLHGEEFTPRAMWPRPRVTVAQQLKRIRQKLMGAARVAYHRLLSTRPTRLEAAVTLLAVLELIKRRLIRAHQRELFGEIVIEPLVPPEQLPTSEVATATMSSPLLRR